MWIERGTYLTNFVHLNIYTRLDDIQNILIEAPERKSIYQRDPNLLVVIFNVSNSSFLYSERTKVSHYL